MFSLYLAFAIFIAFVLFQMVYIIVPIFKNEKKKKGSSISKNYGFSVIVPAYNEEKVIENCILGYLQQDHSLSELIIVNDGSNDRTLNILRELLDLKAYYRPMDGRLTHKEVLNCFRSAKYPSIFVLDKFNGGKADALNAGINFSKNEIIITLDADSIMEQRALTEMNDVFQERSVIASGGNVMIAQAFEGEIGDLRPTFRISGIIRYQFLQYLTAFFLHKRAQASVGAITVIAGAFGAFRRTALFHINGFRSTIGEDMDITLKLHKWIQESGRKQKITFAPSAICYTECPDTFHSMFKQRVRWQKAFIDCLIHYRTCYFTKFSKRFTVFFLIDQFLIGTMNAFPVIITPIVLFSNKGNFVLLLLLGLTAVFLFMYQSITTIFICHLHNIRFSRNDIVHMLLFLPIEIFVYRMINLSFVVYGTISYLYKPQAWNKIERTGMDGWKGVKRA
ncbi:glycosyltransferase family 2 protein [Rossellomorea sp. NS-SX7]|uniref:glycosyltransferase family 2 protein n=1 Tax=Rossellomorea sp. NS-SX7 TaxID=3463856 RepID=UPI004058E2E5